MVSSGAKCPFSAHSTALITAAHSLPSEHAEMRANTMNPQVPGLVPNRALCSSARAPRHNAAICTPDATTRRKITRVFKLNFYAINHASYALCIAKKINLSFYY